MAKVTAWFDGCCEPRNPGGHASFGALVKVDGVRVFEASEYVGFGPAMSNNVAEYSGALAVLRFLLEKGLGQGAEIRGDSKLVVNQLNGKWRAKGGLYMRYYREALRVRLQLPGAMLIWIPRQQNDEADELSKRVLRERNVEFRLQREVRV